MHSQFVCYSIPPGDKYFRHEAKDYYQRDLFRWPALDLPNVQPVLWIIQNLSQFILHNLQYIYFLSNVKSTANQQRQKTGKVSVLKWGRLIIWELSPKKWNDSFISKTNLFRSSAWRKNNSPTFLIINTWSRLYNTTTMFEPSLLTHIIDRTYLNLNQ